MKIRFIKEYHSYTGELNTTKQNGERLISIGVAEEVLEDKPKRGRKPKNKEELKDSIETK
jgi:hypothetical protein